MKTIPENTVKFLFFLPLAPGTVNFEGNTLFVVVLLKKTKSKQKPSRDNFTSSNNNSKSSTFAEKEVKHCLSPDAFLQACNICQQDNWISKRGKGPITGDFIAETGK